MMGAIKPEDAVLLQTIKSMAEMAALDKQQQDLLETARAKFTRKKKESQMPGEVPLKWDIALYDGPPQSQETKPIRGEGGLSADEMRIVQGEFQSFAPLVAKRPYIIVYGYPDPAAVPQAPSPLG